MSIADQSIKVFLEEIASKPGTPAGGRWLRNDLLIFLRMEN
jgi:hypothetical protein